jgi:hypothetical protein
MSRTRLLKTADFKKVRRFLLRDGGEKGIAIPLSTITLLVRSPPVCSCVNVLRFITSVSHLRVGLRTALMRHAAGIARDLLGADMCEKLKKFTSLSEKMTRNS